MVGVMVAEQGCDPMCCVRVAGFGAPARHALRAEIEAAQAANPLAPVTVVVPSALAGSTLQRALTAELGGLVGVSFDSFPALVGCLAAARLAAAGRPPLDGLTARAIAAGLLAEHPGPFATVAEHPATVAALVDTLDELRPLAPAELGALAAASARGAAVVELHRAFVAATAGWAAADDELVAAIDAVAAGDRVVGEVGQVIVHLPRRLGRREVALLAALAGRGRAAIIVGTSGHASADEATEALLADLAAAGLVPAAVAPSPPPGPTAVADDATTAVLAPDAAEEVRHAVRVVRAAIADGIPPERIAIVSRVREPYALLAHEELAALGVDHSAPAPARLAQSIAGRTLLGLLEWLPGALAATS